MPTEIAGFCFKRGDSDAANLFDDAYTNARKAQYASDIDELRAHAFKAMRLAEEALQACEQ